MTVRYGIEFQTGRQQYYLVPSEALPKCPGRACRFGRDFRDVHWVSSPLVYWGLSTTRVLTLEYLPGIKISDVTALRAAGIDTKLVAQRATEAYLIQLLQTSFLHSDVHPGNIGIDRTGEPLHHAQTHGC